MSPAAERAPVRDDGARPELAPPWVHARGALDLSAPRVMAIVNVTPDSFFDGGNLLAPATDDPSVSVAARLCRAYRQQGADILDVGGESTRPGATPVPPDVELRRVLPVIRGLVGDPELAGMPISVDTRHASVAAAAMAAGAAILNDVSGLADPDMARVAADSGAGLVIGHLRGEPATMMREIRFEHVLVEVAAELARAVERALRAGVAADRIAVDPGIGFGKTAEHSAALVGAADYLMRETGCPVLVGASRKAFLGVVGGRPRPVEERLIGSVVAAVMAALGGAAVVRVHDVAATAEALRVAWAIRHASAAAVRAAEGVERGRW
ncbi:dihydropteroate synthase [Nannocystis bainbridge]|uniref:Dihydropteroate synthase n=1 Tax=Nannocystis bainbridge TaxID=2995303 RepID=A0ABT5DRL3_9BACT|nr:dihydropteroate synthase [Nannocystis bainbridge]MDC0715353.1 dihydropteroate synthase [Nannocystis bainbridge]